MATIYPSLMAADQLNLEKEIKHLEPHAVGYHIDIMDYHFAPNLTFGIKTTNDIAAITRKQVWVHAMVENPTSLLDKLTLPAHTIYSFHIESNFKKNDILEKLEVKNWLASIAINPKTNVEKLFEFIDHQTYQVLIMSVEPGFSGQSFIPEVLDNIEPLKKFRSKHNLNFMIGIDGGINEKTITQATAHGIDHIAAASAIFSKPDRVAALTELERRIA